MINYIPLIRETPTLMNKHASAWGDIPTIIKDIIVRFNLKQEKALEFGVEFGYSTSAISNYFNDVTGVDIFTGDQHTGMKIDHFEMTKNDLKDYKNITLIKDSYQDYIEKTDEIYDLIHIDIVHTYEDTFKCGDWSIDHSRIVIFHDTESFDDVKRACVDLSIKHDVEFYNYIDSYGLGILFNPRIPGLQPDLFTIGYIDHDKEIQSKYLAPSVKNLSEKISLISTSDSKFPAANYNFILNNCKTEYLILTHQDVCFSSDIIECIKNTINEHPDFGVLGMVGVDNDKHYKWSSQEIFEVDTLDCCFIVIKKDSSIRFNSLDFDEFHLYVEDFCAKMKKLGKKNYTIKLNKNSKLEHFSNTLSKLGSCWGNYEKYKKVFEKKWPNIKTT